MDSKACAQFFQDPNSSSSRFFVHDDMLCARDLIKGKSICPVSEMVPHLRWGSGRLSSRVTPAHSASAPDFLFLSPPQSKVSKSQDRSLQESIPAFPPHLGKAWLKYRAPSGRAPFTRVLSWCVFRSDTLTEHRVLLVPRIARGCPLKHCGLVSGLVFYKRSRAGAFSSALLQAMLYQSALS